MKTYPGYLGKVHYLLKGLYKDIFLIVLINIFISIVDLLSISVVAPLLISIFSNDLGSSSINIPYLETIQKIFNNNINQMIYLFSSLILIKGLVSLILNKVVLNFGVNFKNITRKKYLSLLIKQQFHKVQNKDSSFYLNLFNNLINKFAQTLMSLMRLSADFLSFILIIIYLTTLDSQLVLILGLFSIIFLTLFDILFRRKLKTIGGKENQFNKLSFKSLTDFIKGQKELNIYSKEILFSNKILNNSYLSTIQEVKRQFISLIPRHLIEPTIIFLILFLYFFLAYILKTSKADIIIIISVFSFAAIRLKPFILNFVNTIAILRAQTNTIDIIYNEFTNLQKILPTKKQSHSKKNTKFSKIIYRNISFKYQSNNKLIDNFNIQIERSKIIGIFGKSGKGKTTILNILTGLIEPDSCEILLDNKKIKSNTYLRNLFSYIPQKPFFIEGTIKENIILDQKSNVSDKKLYEIIRLVGLDYLIKKLPNGINSLISQEGSTLSGGEQQKLAIARAIYFNRKCIVIDEGLNAMDNKNQIMILNLLKVLKSHKYSIVIVSHEKSHFKICDKIYKLR